MATRIPLPGNGGEALQRGVEQGTGLWQQMMGHGVNLGRMHQQGQQFDKRLGFDEKQLAQQHKHHLNEMGVRYKQLEHAEKLLPHQIQHLIDQHMISPYQAMNLYAQGKSYLAEARKNTMFANLLDTSGGQDSEINYPGMQDNMPMQQPGMNAPMMPPMMQQPMQGQPGMATQSPMAQQPMGQQPMGQPPLQRPGFTNQQNIDIPYQPQAQPTQQAQPSQEPMQRVTPEQVQQEVAQVGYVDPADLKPGQTITIRPASNAQKARLDNAAGLMGVHPVVSTDIDGVRYERWPSDKLTATRISASPEQKAELETKKKEQQEINKRHAVERQKLEEELPLAKKRLQQIEDLEQLYIKNKGHKDEWWGKPTPFGPEKFWQGAREYFINDKDYGRIQDIQGDFVGEKSQDYSTKGLAQGLTLADKNKPGFYENYDNALGKIENMKEKAKRAIEREEGRLKELSGGKTSQGKMLTGTIDGEEFDVKPEDKEAFIRNGGKIL